MTANRPILAVMGPAGYGRDLIEAVLDRSDAYQLAPPRDAASAPAVDAAVLVEPEHDDWKYGRRLGVPLAVVTLLALDDEAVVDVVRLGADVVIGMDDGAEHFLEAIEALIGGATVVTPRQVRLLAEMARATVEPEKAAVHLTAREIEILDSISRGETVKQTAKSLGIAPKTVENLQRRMFRKLDVRNRAHAVARVRALGMPAVATAVEEETPPIRRTSAD